MHKGENATTQPGRRTALLLVDVINDMDFDGAAALVRHAEPMARRLQCIPCDCVASNTREENEAALRLMSKVVKADITPSIELDLAKLP